MSSLRRLLHGLTHPCRKSKSVQSSRNSRSSAAFPRLPRWQLVRSSPLGSSQGCQVGSEVWPEPRAFLPKGINEQVPDKQSCRPLELFQVHLPTSDFQKILQYPLVLCDCTTFSLHLKSCWAGTLDSPWKLIATMQRAVSNKMESASCLVFRANICPFKNIQKCKLTSVISLIISTNEASKSRTVDPAVGLGKGGGKRRFGTPLQKWRKRKRIQFSIVFDGLCLGLA